MLEVQQDITDTFPYPKYFIENCLDILEEVNSDNNKYIVGGSNLRIKDFNTEWGSNNTVITRNDVCGACAASERNQGALVLVVDNDEVRVLSSSFTGHIRNKVCVRKDKNSYYPSMYEAWLRDGKNFLINQGINPNDPGYSLEKYADPESEELSDDLKESLKSIDKEFWNKYKNYEATDFNPSIMVELIHNLFLGQSCNNIVDFCGGWGNRLFAAYYSRYKSSHNNKAGMYTCVEPSSLLTNLYKGIVEFWSSEDFENNNLNISVNIIHKALEDTNDSDIEPNKYDLSFTSPPYFDYEDYATSVANLEDIKLQSTSNRTYEEWYHDFLLDLARKSARALKSGGFFAVYIQNVITFTDTMKFVKDVSRMEEFTFFDIIGTKKDSNSKKVRTICVWKRV